MHTTFRIKRSLSIIGLLLLLGTLAGCASAPKWPAITDSPSGEHMPGRWVWLELLSPDSAAAQQFYGSVFDWRFETHTGDRDSYVLIRSEDRVVAGMVQNPKRAVEKDRARWLGLMSVDNVDAAANRSKRGGGTVKLASRQFAGRGDIAVLSDPEGALFGIIHSDDGDPPDVFPIQGSLFWMELWAKDGESMAEFYRTLAGYEVVPQRNDLEVDEWHLMAQDFARAGIIEVEREDLPSAWLPYIRVADLQATLERVDAAGGQLFLAPSNNIRQGRVAIIIDPQGAPLGLAQWPEGGDQ